MSLSQEGELSDGESVNEYAVNEAVSDATGTGTENGLGEEGGRATWCLHVLWNQSWAG